GVWGFSSTDELTKPSLENTLRKAIELARAGSGNHKKIKLGHYPSYIAEHVTPFRIDPFDIPRQTKMDYLLEIDMEARKVKRLDGVTSRFSCIREKKYFTNSEGSSIHQTFIYTGAGVVCTAIKNDDVQVRSYPNQFGCHMG